MEIKRGHQAFYIGESQDSADAIITYKVESDHVIVANSTFVDPKLRGQQVAKKLLDRLAEYARNHNLKIRPTCSYVVKAFERYDEYQDVSI